MLPRSFKLTSAEPRSIGFAYRKKQEFFTEMKKARWRAIYYDYMSTVNELL